MRLRSWRTVQRVNSTSRLLEKAQLTCHTGKELSSKALNLTAWERYKPVSFQEVEDTLAQQVSHNTNVISEVKTVPQMYAFVPIRFVVE